MTIYYIFLFLLGLIFGSFLTSFPYRLLAGEKLPKGRSRCPECKKQIAWYDNIPVLSYFLLSRKCRNCKKPIPFIYPVIEISTGLLFLLFGYATFSCTSPLSPLCQWNAFLSPWSLLFMLFFVVSGIAIFITDMSDQIIPDELSFVFLVGAFLMVVWSGTDAIYSHLLSGFLASLFLLFLHLITGGRGMGLGDVKLALGMGIILGWPFTLLWLGLSFVLGAVVGVALIGIGLASFGRHIAFGPFLIISFFVVLLWGDYLVRWWMPYL